MNSVFLIVFLAMVLVVILLRFHIPIGFSIISGGLLIWAVESLDFKVLWDSLLETAQLGRTWDLFLCLYFVMCLEVELRKSDSLKGLVTTLRNIFSSNKVTLAVMPAFLGLLPSMGGARFSCPIVAEASKGIAVNSEQKSAINLWFRHITEFCNPLNPGMIVGCSIAGISIGALIKTIGWLAILCFILGWIFLIAPLKITDPALATNPTKNHEIDWKSLILGFGPIIVVFVLVVNFHVSAPVALGIGVVGFLPIYYALKRPVPILQVFTENFDIKLFINIFLILYFIQILTNTGTLKEIVDGVNAANLSGPVLFAVLAFIFGLITGMTQGILAIVIPLVAVMDPGNVVPVGIVMAFGMAGQMITPTHLCIVLTVDYFKSNFWVTVGKMAVLVVLMLIIFSTWTYFRYYS